MPSAHPTASLEPNKPRPDFPLFAHGPRRRAKKKWEAGKAALLAGKKPRPASAGGRHSVRLLQGEWEASGGLPAQVARQAGRRRQPVPARLVLLFVAPTPSLPARQMHESRDFGAMPLLADAPQDARCDNEDILNHCRRPGPHVRGCWLVNLVLGKQSCARETEPQAVLRVAHRLVVVADWCRGRAGEISRSAVRGVPPRCSMVRKPIVCYKCKRTAPPSANNPAYCAGCEEEIRRAYETRNDCPRCGSAGERRGTTHWSGMDNRGAPCGGFQGEWFCHQCQQSYVTPQ
jgi:hypothetical protein